MNLKEEKKLTPPNYCIQVAPLPQPRNLLFLHVT
jgi:hypothetical protein